MQAERAEPLQSGSPARLFAFDSGKLDWLAELGPVPGLYTENGSARFRDRDLDNVTTHCKEALAESKCTPVS